jgi:hypothetical protein
LQNESNALHEIWTTTWQHARNVDFEERGCIFLLLYPGFCINNVPGSRAGSAYAALEGAFEDPINARVDFILEKSDA